MTARSVTLSEQASDEEGRSIVEMVLRQRVRSEIEAAVRRDQRQWNRYRALLAEADGLDRAARLARTAQRGRAMRAEAETLRTVARQLPSTLGSGPVAAYDTGDGSFHAAENRAEASLGFPEMKLDRAREAALRAEELRERSLRFTRYVVSLAAVTVIVMVAQLSPVAERRFIGAGAVLLWVLLTAAAFVGDRP
ncbi:MAG: hypothetical protein ACRDKW_06430 [Actinomycetota bacterium]